MPANTPAPTNTDQDAVDALEALLALAEIIGSYVNTQGSTDPLAPMHGDPFVHNDRVYVQLEGRGGAGKGEDFAPTGLRPFIAAHSESAPSGTTLRKALELLGFTRSPFGYRHPERGNSSASYYSTDAKGLGITAPSKRSGRKVAAA